MKKHFVACLMAWSVVSATGEARQTERGPDFSGRWSASLRESVGAISLGGIVEIKQDSRRLTIIRRLNPNESVTWSCPIDGTECQNTQAAGSPPTQSRVQRTGSELIISTRGTGRDSKPVDVRRVLSIDRSGRLVVITTATGTSRRDKTVYAFHGKPDVP